jgi:polyvinyl alcohol dehydrogenase (cytochrome)
VRRPYVAVAAVVLFLGPRPGGALVAGGGSPTTDCFAEFSGVTLDYPAAHPKQVRCTDGDACDADGMANGACAFAVSVCLDGSDTALPGCLPPAGGITSFAVRNAPPGDPRHDPALDLLDSAAGALLPATSPACTSPVTITVPLSGPDRRGVLARGKMVVRTTAASSAGREDRDRLRLVCLPQSGAPLADWPQYGFDAAQSRHNPREGLIARGTAARLKVRWFQRTDAAVTASPTVVGGTAYVGSWNGTMYALDVFSGAPRWTFDIHDPNPNRRNGFPGIQSSANVTGGRVYFGAADAHVYALDAASGGLVWRTALGDPDPNQEGAHVWSSPAVLDGRVYVGKSSHLDFPCVAGTLSALDGATGGPVWRFDVLPDHVCSNDGQHACATDADCPGGTCIPFLVCRTTTFGEPQTQLCISDADCTPPKTCLPPKGGGVTSSPAVDASRRTVYVSTGDCVGFGAAGFANSILALDADTGALRWFFKAVPNGDLEDFDFIASPNLFDGPGGRALVGAGNKSGIYYALDRDTGALVWQRLTTPAVPNLFGGFNASAGVAFGKIYAATFSGPPFIFALAAADGTTAWQCAGTDCGVFSFSPPGIADGVVLMGDSQGMLRAFDADSGAILRTLDLGGAIDSGPALVDGMVIVGAGEGVLGRADAQGIYGLAVK